MADFLTIEPGTVSTRELHGYLLSAVAPRPIAFASTISPDGVPNLAPFSFFNVFSSNPPTVIFSPARRVRGNTTKHTLENVLAIPEVVVNVVNYAIVEQMNLASAEFAEGVNEFTKAGLTEVASEVVRPPRILEAPVQLECRVVEIKPLGNHGGAGQLIFGRVVRVHVNKSVLDDNQKIDPHKIDLVARMGGMHYCRASGDAVFSVDKPGSPAGMGIDSLPEAIRNSSVLTGNDLGKLGHIAELPDGASVQTWWQAHGSAFQGQDVHAMAKALLAENKVHDALMLLLGSKS